MTLFVDLDGVVCDFDSGYEAMFGVRPDKVADNVDWEAVRRTPNFYLNLPPMPDMFDLWDYIEPYKPIILTGIPSSVPEAADNKTAWVRRVLGPSVQVRACLSKEKCLHCNPGDVLIDDWVRYRHLWELAGGRWITHVSAKQTIIELNKIDHLK